MRKTITSAIFSLSLIGLTDHVAAASQSHKVSENETEISTLAEKYASTTSEIIQLNGLSENTTHVVEGTTLLLPEQDIVEVKSGDTLYKISAKYQVSLEKIYELNPTLSETILEGQRIAISEKGAAHLSPFGDEAATNYLNEQYTTHLTTTQHQTTPEFQSYQQMDTYIGPLTTHNYANTHSKYYGESDFDQRQKPAKYTQSYNFGSNNNYYDWGQCTYYAFERRQQLGKSISALWGNANNWASAAQNQGFKVNNKPVVGAVFQTTAGPYGHVGVVEKTNKDGSIVVSEMNWQGVGKKSYRTISNIGAYQYIH